MDLKLGDAYTSNNQIQTAIQHYEYALQIAIQRRDKEAEIKAYRGSVHLLRILQWWGKTTKGPIRAVASIYSWGGWGGGGVGQKFPNDEKIS